MMVKLNMSIVGQPGLSLTDIVPGLLCSASSIIDKRWYRAVVISAHDGSGGVSLCEGRGGDSLMPRLHTPPSEKQSGERS